MVIVFSIGVILVCSILIYFICEKFAVASSNIGDYLRMPRSVKGATFDAISSSLPELLVALFAVIFFGSFEVGIGTVAGSALFNLLVIPGICVFVSPVIFKLSHRVISRDALFYMISVFVLIVLLVYFKTWGVIVAVILLSVYLVYIKEIFEHTREFKKTSKRKEKKKGIWKDLLVLFFGLLGIGIVTYFLTKYSIELAEALSVSPIIIAFTITAAATSVPDTVISVVNAKKGDIDDATSNVFGSNIFDILVGLGLPLLIYSIYKGAVEINFVNLEIVLGLLGSTILVMYFIADKNILTKKHGAIMLVMYLFFIGYTIYLSLV
jgi:K+-dependent Na+/Ca+ exchanger-like protein